MTALIALVAAGLASFYRSGASSRKWFTFAPRRKPPSIIGAIHVRHYCFGGLFSYGDHHFPL
ncbi:hypothetical protein FD525_06890 [Cutibacterium acnes]|nr:hypothetical protein EGX38_01390 [Cutibacterium acnes]EFS37144.1 hypothetical protein HMPREF9574_02552 [Cutibacterium acnes HL074PA1]EFS49511.1 hypothetical protein HMPREF9585_00285 [Cutibacterium acnes HL083PA1]EFS70046.1 hypothetical protein HMPREF9616_00204 [Cutibacterium acnes HL007PA1]EFS70506.1 hypothetical protein HMPREF9617_02212 [Cutibacterium acnes HL056PA1]EFT08353.1 hypothetical protein HMPREF9618_00810 [Cutibacterium acnes HL082PA1]EGE93348.1 hypothetical protein HMPREF9571_01